MIGCSKIIITLTFIYCWNLQIRDMKIHIWPSPSMPASSKFSTSVSSTTIRDVRRSGISGSGVSRSGVSGNGVSGSDVSGGGISRSGIFHLPLSLDVNLHIIVRLDIDGSSAATKALVTALAEAFEDGGRLPIAIRVAKLGDSWTIRGDSRGATVGDAYISPFSGVSSGKTFTRNSLEIFAQGN